MHIEWCHELFDSGLGCPSAIVHLVRKLGHSNAVLTMFEKWWLFADVWGVCMLHDAWIFIAWFAWFSLVYRLLPFPMRRCGQSWKPWCDHPSWPYRRCCFWCHLSFPCFLNFPRTSNPMVLKVEFLTMVPHHAPHIWFLRSTCDVTSCLKSRCQLAIFKEQRPRVLRKRWSESEIKLQWLICTLLQCGGGSSVKKNYRPHIKLADVHAPSCTYIYTMLRFGLGYRSSHILHHAPPCPCTMKTV